MTRQYDPRDVNVIVDSEFLTGFADGTFVSCEKEEDAYETYVGAQGEVVRSRNAHPIGTITVTLEHTSPSNNTLNRLANSRNVFPAYMVDRNTRQTTIGGSECWIQKPADEERGDEVSEVEWVIVVADYEKR